MFINFSPRFTRSYKKLSEHLKKDFDKKIAIFIKQPTHPSLHVHKLKGSLESCCAFSLRDGYRVLFEIPAPQTINLLQVGPHKIYKEY